MPQNIGSVSLEANLDLRKATQQYNRFQRTISQKGRKDNVFAGISSDAKDFENSLGKATNRVVAFGAAAAIFSTIAQAASAFASSIIEVDKSLAAINVNLGQSSQGLKKFGSDLFNIARQTGQTFDVAAKAAEELARQGLSAEETTKRLKDALILSRVAGIGSAEAVDTLTAAINSFNQEALTSTEVINKFAAVDTKFAVSSADLANAISRVGSTAQSAGVGINELIGLVTSLQQTTARGGATIGNGLKTIFTRIQAAPETVAALQSVGVAIKNTDGSLRDAISILRDYGAAREKVGEAERASLDRTVAGTQQINILKATLADITKQWSVYGSAVTTATNATDEAIRKNEQLNQTYSSLINSVGLSVKQLFANLGEQRIGGIFKQALNEFEEFRKYLSGDAGDQIGEYLGDGILKGLGNVLGGPALLAIGKILINAFIKVGSTLLVEARTLLAINSSVQTRANIQKQINVLLANATDAERAQYVAASSLLAKKEQILAIQSRINQEELAGSPIARSFETRGRLGMGTVSDPRIRRGNRTGIPSFADPIQSAISREKAAGVPANQIYVDRDPRVANFANPAGILVANKRDEPLGGFQGVNRVIAQGGNPKTSGFTPNFATPSRRNPFDADEVETQRIIKTLNEQSKNFGLNLKSLSMEIKKVARQISSEMYPFGPQLPSYPFGPQLPANYGPSFGSYIGSRVVSDQGNAVNKYVTPEGGFDRSGTFVGLGDRVPNTGGRYGSRDAYRAAIVNRRRSFEDRLPNNFSPSRQDEIKAANERQSILRQELRRNARETASKRAEAAQTAKLAAAESKIQSRRNLALGGSFALPFAAGFIPEGKGGTTSGQLFGAAQGAAQGAGIGGIFGPKGLAIGAVVGALVGGFNKLTKSSQELGAELQQAAALRGEETDAIARVKALREQIKEGQDAGLSPSVIRKLEDQLAQNTTKITSSSGQAILSAAPGKQQDEAERTRELENSLKEAAKNISDIVGKRATGNLGRAFAGGLNQDIVKGVGPQQNAALRAAALGTFNVQARRGTGEFRGEILNAGEVDKADQDFLEAKRNLAPVIKDFVAEADITKDNIKELAQAFSQGVLVFRKVVKEQENRKTPAGGLPSGAFLNKPNLDVFSGAARMGRNGRATPGERAESQFGLFQELISSGAVTQTTLESTGEYKSARAGTQFSNLLKTAAAFLEGNNPEIAGKLTNERGEISERLINTVLSQVAKGGGRNASTASRFTDYMKQARATINNDGFDPGLSYSPAFAQSDSGLAPGGKINTYAGSLKSAQELVTKTLEAAEKIVVKTTLQVDGTVKVVSDTLSKDQLTALAAELTATIGKKFEAEISAINNQISSMQGKPTPPTPIPSNSAFGNTLYKGTDGFVRSKP